MQDYFWIKLGIHEFVYDLHFDEWGDNPEWDDNSDIREAIVNSLRQNENLRNTWRKKCREKGIGSNKKSIKESLEKFVKNKLT